MLLTMSTLVLQATEQLREKTGYLQRNVETTAGLESKNELLSNSSAIAFFYLFLDLFLFLKRLFQNRVICS